MANITGSKLKAKRHDSLNNFRNTYPELTDGQHGDFPVYVGNVGDVDVFIKGIHNNGIQTRRELIDFTAEHKTYLLHTKAFDARIDLKAKISSTDFKYNSSGSITGPTTSSHSPGSQPKL